jgi:hypothetical protein
VEGIAVERCDVCKGHYVTHDAMEALVKGRPRSSEARRDGYAPPPGDASREVECPRCGDAMKLGFFGHGCSVRVDVCALHGTWFDALDLEMALDAVSAGTPWLRPEQAVRTGVPRIVPPPPPRRFVHASASAHALARPRAAVAPPFPFPEVIRAAKALLSAARNEDRDGVEAALAVLEALARRR